MDMYILIQNPEKLPNEITNWDKLYRKKIDESYLKNLKAKPKMMKLIGSGVTKLIGSGVTKAKAAPASLKINLVPSALSEGAATTIDFSDIKQHLTGYARCVIYKEAKLNGKTTRLFVSLNEG
jgi:hypothetical protein